MSGTIYGSGKGDGEEGNKESPQAQSVNKVIIEDSKITNDGTMHQAVSGGSSSERETTDESRPYNEVRIKRTEIKNNNVMNQAVSGKRILTSPRSGGEDDEKPRKRSLNNTASPPLPKCQKTLDVSKTDYPTENGQYYGQCIIINNVNYSNSRRYGSNEDAISLVALFQGLGYEVTLINDATINKLEEQHDKFLNKDFSKTNILVACIMSHGRRTDHFTLTDDKEVNFDDIFSRWFMADDKELLRDTPKVCFIQACQGNKRILETYPSDNEVDGEIKLKVLHRYIAVSTIPDHISYRNPEYGSWFMQSLVNVVEKHATTLNVDQIMYQVKRDVVEGKTGPSTMQCPNVRKNTLIYNLYLGHKASSQDSA